MQNIMQLSEIGPCDVIFYVPSISCDIPGGTYMLADFGALRTGDEGSAGTQGNIATSGMSNKWKLESCPRLSSSSSSTMAIRESLAGCASAKASHTMSTDAEDDPKRRRLVGLLDSGSERTLALSPSDSSSSRRDRAFSFPLPFFLAAARAPGLLLFPERLDTDRLCEEGAGVNSPMSCFSVPLRALEDAASISGLCVEPGDGDVVRARLRPGRAAEASTLRSFAECFFDLDLGVRGVCGETVAI